MSLNGEHIVITGAGLNCCLGLDRHEVWQAVRDGRCGIGPLTELEQPDAMRDGGQTPNLDATDDPDQPREVRYLRRAIREALREANLTSDIWPDSKRVGLVLGTTLAGMRAGGMFLRTDDPTALRGFLAGSVLDRAAHDLVNVGFSLTTCAACASGLSAIAMGMTLLARGELDVVIAGGYDTVSEYVYAGFNSLRLITVGPPLPFSRHRQGMKLGEGTGIVVLERADDAANRGAQPLAAVLGFGESTDAYHLTKPHPEGIGAAEAIVAALTDAGVEAREIDMISAHATATPNNDAAEFAAYQRVFGERLREPHVTAFKSHLGHTLGAAGAVELILSMMSMHDGLVPPLANVRAEDIEFDGLNVVTGAPREAAIRRSINLSLGFGGANSCMVLGRAGHPQSTDAIRPKQVATTPRADGRQPTAVCITGIGVIVPGCVGNEAFLDRLNNEAHMGRRIGGDIDEEQLLPLFANARRVRRFSTFVKLLLAAANEAVRHAGLDSPQGASMIERSCAFLGSTLGAVGFTEQYYRQVVEEGIDAANPMLFAEGVPNVASAQLSLLLNLRGSTQTIMGTRTAGLDALHMAARRIASGSSERAIVGAAEEHGELVNRVYRSFGLYRAHATDDPALPFGDASGFVTGAGAVVLVLESIEAAQRRGANVHAVIEANGQGRGLSALEVIGRPMHVVSSANNTWIDDVERAAIEHVASEPPIVHAIYGHVPEMFSVTPLAALASVVLSRRMPRLLTANGDSAAQQEIGVEPPANVGVLATDFNGAAAAVCLRLH